MIPHRTCIALLALAASGCSQPQVFLDDVSFSYTAVEFSAAADGRDLWTVIVGNPFGGDQAAFDEAVTDAMEGVNYGPVTNFTTTPNETARLDYKVVLVFNPDPPIGSDRICRERPIPTNPAVRPILVRAAFCIQGNFATRATGRLADAASPDDPLFAELISDLTLNLFPPANPLNVLPRF